MKTSRIAIAALLTLGLTVLGSDALAGKKSSDSGKKKQTTEETSTEESQYKQIRMGKIKEFKPTYTSAKGLLETVTSFETALNQMHDSTREAGDIAKDEPLKKAFNKTKRTASDKLIVTLEKGRIPKVSAKDAPDNVTTFIDQVNLNVDIAEELIQGAKAVPEQVDVLVGQLTGIPASITPDLMKKNNLKVKDLQKQVNVAKHNLDATKEAKPRAEGVLKSARHYMDLVKSLAETD
jgi:hypothetical protein